MWPLSPQFPIVRSIPRFIEIVLRIEFFLAEERQQQDAPTMPGLLIRAENIRRRKRVVLVVILMQREADLLQIRFAGRKSRRVASAAIDLPTPVGDGDQQSRQQESWKVSRHASFRGVDGDKIGNGCHSP